MTDGSGDHEPSGGAGTAGLSINFKGGHAIHARARERRRSLLPVGASRIGLVPCGAGPQLLGIRTVSMMWTVALEVGTSPQTILALSLTL